MSVLTVLAALAARLSTAPSLVAENSPLPLTVDVGLLGFSADGAWQVELDAAELFGLLNRLLPSRQPRCGPDGEPADATYNITYNVVQMRTGLPRLHEQLASAMKPAPGGDRLRYEVRTEQIEGYFERTYEAFFQHPSGGDAAAAPSGGGGPGGGPAYSILIVNPNRADVAALLPPSLRPPEGYSYHYRLPADDAPPTQMWISHRRYMVVDLSAGPLARGMRGATEGAVSRGSVPELGPELQGGPEGAAKRDADVATAQRYALAHTTLLSRLASLVLSAVTHVVAPDMRSCAVAAAAGERVVVPLVVLRNHRAFDPLTPGHAHSIDLAALRAQLKRLLLPSQPVTLLPSTHDLHQHPQVSVALALATRSDTAHGVDGAAAQPYIDSASLAHELRHSVDWLTSGLMESSHRVLPVFVFSLLGMHPSLLLDRASLVHADDAAVLVLQTNTSQLRVPFYASSASAPGPLRASSDAQPPPMAVSTLAPTSHALAGLASALGALVSPFESFGTDGTPALDFHWAVGYHPFGPFASSLTIPDVMADSARRHTVLATLSAATDVLHDATAAVEALAARYVHPSEADSPAHREQIERLHAEAQGANPSYERALRHLHLHDEEAHAEPELRHELQQQLRSHLDAPHLSAEEPLRKPPVGALLQRLRHGTLSLSSDFAKEHALRLHEMLLGEQPKLSAAADALARGQLDAAYAAAKAAHAAAAKAAHAALDQIGGLEAGLGCCHVESSRPRSYHLGAIGGLIALGGVVWLGVLRLTQPIERRGTALPYGARPGTSARWGFGWGGRRQQQWNAKQY